MRGRDDSDYLRMHGAVYGLTPDSPPERVAQVVASLRRRDARVQAAARRELRAQIAMQSTPDLRQQVRAVAYLLTLSDGIRPAHIKRVDQSNLRMIMNELRRRRDGKALTARDWRVGTWPVIA